MIAPTPTTLPGPTEVRHVAITGAPGTGKTTLARGLGALLGWDVVGTGDIARAADPESLATGGMAEESAFREAFHRVMAAAVGRRLILDGIPRSRSQLELLPPDTKIVLLTCRSDVARARLLRRGRPDDDFEIINRRLREQTDLLEVEVPNGWVWGVVGKGVVNTTQKQPEAILRDMYGYLIGTRREPY